MAVLKDCHQRLPKWWLSLKIVIKDCRSDGCLERLSSKTAEVITVLKDCHQRLPKWWLSVKIVIKDCRSDGSLERLSSKTTEVMAVCKDCHRRLEKRVVKWCLSWKTVCHQRLPKWWLSWKIVEVMSVIKDYRSDGCHQRLEKRLLKWCLSSKTREMSVIFLLNSLLNLLLKSLFSIKISIRY